MQRSEVSGEILMRGFVGVSFETDGRTGLLGTFK